MEDKAHLDNGGLVDQKWVNAEFKISNGFSHVVVKQEQTLRHQKKWLR